MRSSIPILLALSLSSLVPGTAARQDYTGRWTFTGTGEHANRVYWLEVSDNNGQLSGMFLNRTGSPVPLESVRIENGELLFQMRGAVAAPRRCSARDAKAVDSSGPSQTAEQQWAC